MRFLKAVALIFTALILSRCQREISYVGNSDPQIVLPEAITATLQGNVFDETGQPEPGVTITVGSQTATTDAKGYFRFTNAALDKNASLVIAEKPGYFKTFRTFGATSGSNHIEIKLVKRNLAGTISATTGGDATLSNGTKINLPANGVVVASSGAAYTGNISVYAAYLDPSSSDIYETVPGSFMANDKNGGRVLLSSYGMLAVELESASGQKLQIKSGSTASLTTPIPAGAQASAPASIPLWYVDEQTGLWKEEGTATKQGNAYVGDVKHFTYWNCDLPLPTVNYSVKLVDANGRPMVNVSVMIRPTTGTYYGSAHGYTDSLGQLNGPVPANLPLVMQITDPCGNVIFSQNIGPFNQNTNGGTITVNISPTSPSVYTVKGKLTNCASGTVTNGFAMVIMNNRVHYASVDASGNFIATFILCSNPGSVDIVGVDQGGQQQSSLATFSVSGSVTDVGTVNACGTSATQFINFTLDGTNYAINTADSILGYTMDSTGTTNDVTMLMGTQSNAVPGIYIRLNFHHANQTAGTYQVNELFVMNYLQNTVVQPFNITVANFPTVPGQFYEGSFSGGFTNGSTTHTITNGSFKIRRSQ